ncbi:MAG: bifunctional UDP-N-acetylglucosamine diphosphorylase/glucosamine-1-phosphate N-acetyltransferase GlmU [Vulcanimicrobiota bacterium]
MKEIVAVILAAGKSTRMKTKTPKILHEIMGKPMIDYVLQATQGAGVTRNIVVIGHEKEKIKDYLKDTVLYAEQNQQLGTAHAVLQALPHLSDFHGDLMVVCGDMPLLSENTLKEFALNHKNKNAKVSLLTAIMEDPARLGRIIRGRNGTVKAIVEAADATDEQLLIKEVNTGTYIFDIDYLRELLPEISSDNAQNELYLTDSIELSQKKNISVEATVCKDSLESLGVNNRVQIALAARVIKERINNQFMMEGVTIMDPSTTYIEASVRIGSDTLILPQTMISGKTLIKTGCTIGPNTHIENCRIGENVEIRESVLSESEIGDNCKIGPFAHIRPGTRLAEKVKIGNFVETKKSVINTNTKVSHLSYIGDATLGKNVNIGAGTITCNYDGVRKNPTTIEDGVFIGSNSSLVAPIKIGEGAATGAGAVATKDIPPYKLAVGQPARAIKTLKRHQGDG